MQVIYKVRITTHKDYMDISEVTKHFKDFNLAKAFIDSIILKNFGTTLLKIEKLEVED